MHAPPKTEHPEITPEILATYDAILIGIPTRYGNMPAQWKVCLTQVMWQHLFIPLTLD